MTKWLLVSCQVTCDSPFICSNTTLSTSTEDTYTSGNGYKSIYGKGASISNNACNTVSCGGSHSCQKISFIDVGCSVIGSGAQSLSYVDQVILSDNLITCDTASCIFSTLISHGGISCYGNQACINANIKGSEIINGDGAYSLMNAIIDSESNMTSLNMNVELRGYYAGYNLTIICQSNDTCTVTCYGNACQKTFLKCHPESVCNVINCDDINIPCPKYINYSDDNPYYNVINDNFTLLFDIIEIMNDINDECDYNSGALSYDDKVEAQGNIIVHDKGSICCRGDTSCRSANITQYSQFNANVLCTGAESCELINPLYISGINGTVYCLSRFGCIDARIIYENSKTGGTVYCSGYSSCESIEIINASTVWCDGGRGSCRESIMIGIQNIYVLGSRYQMTSNANFISNGIGNFTVYLMAYEAGKDLNIYCNETDTCTVYCGMCIRCIQTNIFIVKLFFSFLVVALASPLLCSSFVSLWPVFFPGFRYVLCTVCMSIPNHFFLVRY